MDVTEPSSGFTKAYFTDRSPKGVFSPKGVLTAKGLFALLLDLSLEGNFYPICKTGTTLYSNSHKGVSGRYYVLSKTEESVLFKAVSKGLLEFSPKDRRRAYIDFTESGLKRALSGYLPSRLVDRLRETSDAFLKKASRNIDAVCHLIQKFETDLIRARSFCASDFTYHNIVNILHKLMLDPTTALEYLTRQQNQLIRQKPIENNCSLFDLYVGPNARVIHTFEQGMFMSVRRDDSDYRLGKWHGGYNHLDDYTPLTNGYRAITRGDWLKLKVFEVYGDDYTVEELLNVLRNSEVSHSLLSKRESLARMMEIANRNLRGDGDIGKDDARGVHETLVYLGYYVGNLLRVIRCWRSLPANVT